MRAVFVLAALAGCLDSGAPPAPDTPTEAPRPRRSLPSIDLDQPPPPKLDVSLGDGIELRRPITSGRLSLIPIIERAKPRDTKFITLQAGMASHQVSVIDILEIQAVRFENSADQPLVVMGGELIIDGYQDRMVQHDTVIAPHSSQQVAVYCVERGRFEGNAWFHTSGVLGEPTLRHAAATGSQGDVWDRVDEINTRDGLSPPTSTYRQAARRQSSSGTVARRTSVIAELDALEERDQVVGHAIAIDGNVVAIDRFATPALYRQLRTMVLTSYLHVSQGAARKQRDLGPAAVQAFARVNPPSVIGASRRPSRSQPAAPPPAALDFQ